MKKHFSILVIILCPIFLFSQNVGIATEAPAAKLTIKGTHLPPHIPSVTSNGILRIEFLNERDALDIGKSSAPSYSAWLQSGFNGMPDPLSLQPLGGNVGIGILSPSELLHVNGNVKVAGTISGVSDPVDAQDAATKAYVEQLLLDFALATMVDTSKSVQGLLSAGIAPVEIINSGIDTTHFIGLNHAGGIIFYMESDGTGLVAALTDQGDGAEWGCIGTDLPNVDNVPFTIPLAGPGAQIGDGFTNTTAILSAGNCPTAPAASDCTTYTGGGFSGWFLPSAGELNEMWVKLADSDSDGFNMGSSDPNNLGGFEASFYWSSSEFDHINAWGQNFSNGDQVNGDKLAFIRVRAIRAF